MLKTLLTRILLVSLIIVSFSSALIANPKEAKAFDYNYLASDGGFVNINGLTVQGVQEIFVANGSFLKDLSENGRSAAQIIYDAAHGYNEASGTLNGIVIDTNTGTINPIAILATIQKEEGLVTGYYAQAQNYNQVRVDWAMGYGYTDDIIYQQYKGFTKQIEWGAWQLRYNYERASGHGFSDYQVGQTQIIDDVAITFSNRATSALYRYTPHLGTNFTYYFDLWGGNSLATAYQAAFVSQSAYTTVANWEVKTLNISYLNTGSQTWTKNVVNLGLVDQNYHWLWGGYDMRVNWLSPNRLATLNEDTVAPGEIGTFTFLIGNSNAPAGNHRLDVGLVADGITWFNQGTHAYWDVMVP